MTAAAAVSAIQRTATGTYTITMDDEPRPAWAPVDGKPKTVAYESTTRPFKNRKRRRTEAAMARRGR